MVTASTFTYFGTNEIPSTTDALVHMSVALPFYHLGIESALKRVSQIFDTCVRFRFTTYKQIQLVIRNKHQSLLKMSCYRNYNSN